MLSALNGTERHPVLINAHPHAAGQVCVPVCVRVSMCVSVDLCACVRILLCDLFFEKEPGSKKGVG